MQLRVHKIIDNTSVAGPGQRFCIWVQGCQRRCEGCLAVSTWDANGGYLADSEDIIQQALSASELEGITFLGGEPFLQAKALAHIGNTLKSKGLSIVTFTGYTYEELTTMNNANKAGNTNDADYNALLSVTDLLIDGAFHLTEKSLKRPWVGSDNQRYIFLTGRYSEKDIRQTGNKLEVRIEPGGKATVTGMGDFKKMQEYLTGSVIHQ